MWAAVSKPTTPSSLGPGGTPDYVSVATANQLNKLETTPLLPKAVEPGKASAPAPSASMYGLF